MVYKSFPENFRKSLGIKGVTQLTEIAGIYEDKTQNQSELTLMQLQSLEKILKTHFKELRSSHGVMPIRLDFADHSAHRIYLRFDRSHTPPIFRLGEPNAGIFELENNQELLNCFYDLCQVFYKINKVKHLSFYQLDLLK